MAKLKNKVKNKNISEMITHWIYFGGMLFLSSLLKLLFASFTFSLFYCANLIFIPSLFLFRFLLTGYYMHLFKFFIGSVKNKNKNKTQQHKKKKNFPFMMIICYYLAIFPGLKWVNEMQLIGLCTMKWLDPFPEAEKAHGHL